MTSWVVPLNALLGQLISSESVSRNAHGGLWDTSGKLENWDEVPRTSQLSLSRF